MSNDNNDGWDHDRESMIHSLATRQADKDNRIELIGLNEFTKVADAVQELRNMADRELASDARKAHADVTEACKALSEVNDAVKELQAIIEEQKAEIKRLRAECGEAERTILRLESQYGVARVERNAAQRRVCELACNEVDGLSPLKVSELNGWDCFEKEKPRKP